MNKIEEIKDEICKNKKNCIELYDFESAVCWRDIERIITTVIYGDMTVYDFIAYVKKQINFKCYDKICNVIKPLERREKLSKIEKLYNNK